MTTVTASRVCQVDGCARQTGASGSARGLCRPHYTRLRTTGDPQSGKPIRQRIPAGDPSRRCLVPGCSRDYYVLGYCTTHYGRYRQHGDATIVMTRGVKAGPVRLCTVDGCGRQCHAHGFCASHMRRIQVGWPVGRPLAPAALPELSARPCVEPNCERPYFAKGYCRNHYAQSRYQARAQQRRDPLKGRL